MGQLTFDHQVTKQTCNHCNQDFKVSRGSIYEDGQGIGIYLAALHSCEPEPLAHLAIAIRNGMGTPIAIAIRVWPTQTEFQMTITDANLSPWQNENYLGHIMDREEALNSQRLNTFLHIAEHLIAENPEVKQYLSSAN